MGCCHCKTTDAQELYCASLPNSPRSIGHKKTDRQLNQELNIYSNLTTKIQRPDIRDQAYDNSQVVLSIPNSLTSTKQAPRLSDSQQIVDSGEKVFCWKDAGIHEPQQRIEALRAKLASVDAKFAFKKPTDLTNKDTQGSSQNTAESPLLTEGDVDAVNYKKGRVFVFQ